MQIQLFVGNTMNLLLSGLAYEGGAYINSADTATVTITDRDNAEVLGQTWPSTLAYVAASNGNYEGLLSASIELIAGQKYFVEVSATKDGNVGFWRQSVVAAERRF